MTRSSMPMLAGVVNTASEEHSPSNGASLSSRSLRRRLKALLSLFLLARVSLALLLQRPIVFAAAPGFLGFGFWSDSMPLRWTLTATVVELMLLVLIKLLAGSDGASALIPRWAVMFPQPGTTAGLMPTAVGARWNRRI